MMSAWGKRDSEGSEQPLDLHCRDVAIVFAQILRLPGIRVRLCKLGRSQTFPDAWIDRLSWFVFLHDLGKVNAGFQARRDPTAPPIGHVAPIAAAIDLVMEAIKIDRTFGWAEDMRLEDWFHAVLSHHGKPWAFELRDENRQKVQSRLWQANGAYDPVKELELLRQFADKQFPHAFLPDVAPIPLEFPLIHSLAGLVMLADWIASSDWRNSPNPGDVEIWANDWLLRIGLDPQPWREMLKQKNPTFEMAFGFSPNPAQRAFVEADGPLAILEAETGSGKTEAALWRFVQRFAAGAVDGLFFALPRTSTHKLRHQILVATSFTAAR